MKVEQVNLSNGIKNFQYVERMIIDDIVNEDVDGEIITTIVTTIVPYVSRNGSVIKTGGEVELPNETIVEVAPIIALIEAPTMSHSPKAALRPVQFKTAVFLHKAQMVSYLKGEINGNNNPDRIFQFRAHTDGLYVEDMTKGEGILFTPESLVALNVINDVQQWNYREKMEQWFENDWQLHTGIGIKSFFLQDVGKIPVGGSMLNNQAWAMQY
jgi:hypothetical protein